MSQWSVCMCESLSVTDPLISQPRVIIITIIITIIIIIIPSSLLLVK